MRSNKFFLLLIICFILLNSFLAWGSDNGYKKNLIILNNDSVQKYEFDSQKNKYIPQEKFKIEKSYQRIRGHKLIKIKDYLYLSASDWIIKLDSKLNLIKEKDFHLIKDIETDGKHIFIVTQNDPKKLRKRNKKHSVIYPPWQPDPLQIIILNQNLKKNRTINRDLFFRRAKDPLFYKDNSLYICFGSGSLKIKFICSVFLFKKLDKCVFSHRSARYYSSTIWVLSPKNEIIFPELKIFEERIKIISMFKTPPYWSIVYNEKNVTYYLALIELNGDENRLIIKEDLIACPKIKRDENFIYLCCKRFFHIYEIASNKIVFTQDLDCETRVQDFLIY